MFDKWLWIVIEICNAFFEIMLMFMFVGGYSRSELKLKRFKLLLLGFCCACFSFTVSYFFVSNALLFPLTSILLSFSISMLAYSNKIKTSIMLAFFLSCLAAIAELIAVVLIGFFQDSQIIDFTQFTVYRFQALIIKNIIVFVVVKILTRIRNNSSIQLPFKIWAFLMLMPILTLLVMFDLTLMLINSPNNYTILTTFSVIGLSFSNFWFFFIVENILKGIDMQKRLQISEIVSDAQKQRIIDLATNSKELRSFAHDMKQHAILLQSLAEGKNFKDLTEYIQKFSNRILPIKLLYNTGSPSLDALLSFKEKEAESNNIKCKWEVKLSTSLSLCELDLCLLIGNALDNAIEACIKLDEGREIVLKMEIEESTLLIEIKNSINQMPTVLNSRLSTSKKDTKLHGFGIPSMTDCCKRMGGNMSYDFDKKRFLLRVLIPISLFGK